MCDLGPECRGTGHPPNNPKSRVQALMAAVAAAKQPDGQIFAFAVGQIRFRTPGILSRGRGVGHRHERWDGMRWTRRRRARDGMAGRAFRPRERSQDVRTSGAEADGEVVWY